MPQPQGYSRIQIFLHWTIAALIIFQFFVNEAMQHAFSDRIDGEPIEQMGGVALHIGAGLTVLVLAIIRVAVRLVGGVPAVHEDTPLIIKWLGLATHYLLYGFIFAMPLAGAVAWFGANEWAAELHELGRLVLIPAISFHAMGALVEHFVFKKDTLMRMLRSTAE